MGLQEYQEPYVIALGLGTVELQIQRSVLLCGEHMSHVCDSSPPAKQCQRAQQSGEKNPSPSFPACIQPWPPKIMSAAFNQQEHLGVRLCVFVFTRRSEGLNNKPEREKQMISWFCGLVCSPVPLWEGCNTPGPSPSSLTSIYWGVLLSKSHTLSLLKSHCTSSTTMQTEGWVSYSMNAVLSHQQTWGATQVPHSGLLLLHHHVPPPAPSAPCTPAQVEPGGGFIHTNRLWFFTHSITWLQRWLLNSTETFIFIP